MRWEVEKKAIKGLRERKATGCDRILSEVLKAIGTLAASILTNLVNRV